MLDLVQKKHYYNCLYGFYGKLLTDKQQQIFELSFYQDWSLAEIAEELKVSRNAVFDALKTVENLLDGFEEKLALYAKEKALQDLLNSYETKVNQAGSELIKKIREME
ncbi:MAG: sigma factor-like helix-turn-helix DNA-binding protein [Bacilli bacterium]|jgi:predicted DNA-binding protein YlxM (UPF0122 family)|nr:sigma factor-like helix-turn-helix DNA-binding protein [Bacilli bacterium]HHU23894.1 hypothetical protein [Acholeplasmataceae bacterium]